MRTVAIVQARMTSTRLPGKILQELAGQPMLARQLERLARCRKIDEIVVATTGNAADDPVVALAERAGARWHRGSEHDVLARYLGAAREAAADLVVRITSDCPLLAPEVTDRVVAALDDRHDYASNVLVRTYPRGLDTEAFHRDTLERLARMAASAPAREHVTYFLTTERPELFARVDVTDVADHSDLRWTVDTPADLAMVRRLYEDLGLADRDRPYDEIVAHVRAHPAIADMNAGIAQKPPEISQQF